jgi:hypothetical protein
MTFSPVTALRRLLERGHARNATKPEPRYEAEMGLAMQEALNGMIAIQEDDAAFREAVRRIRIATLRRCVWEEYKNLVQGEQPIPDEEARG